MFPNVSAQHKPRRTCIGCRTTGEQDQLTRWVVEAGEGGNAIVADPSRRRSGRGAWLHPSPECAALAVKRRAFARAFRAPADAVTLEAVLAALGAFPRGSRAETTVQPESGSEN
ncbi:YlxR family protein [Arthrobacter halodurans]|uniref:YlxR family protein n=1 Tax=Arthrobacter halodurans TaxID=516699 RepID=A0ABV4UNC0_9MICC